MLPASDLNHDNIQSLKTVEQFSEFEILKIEVNSKNNITRQLVTQVIF